MSIRTNRLKRLVLAVVVLSLPGCAKLFTEPPRPLFRLAAPSGFPGNLPHSRAQLVIDVPYAPAALDTARIAVAKSLVSLDYLADGDWTDRAPALVQTALIEAFENSRAVAAVGPESFGLHADFVLEGDLRHFEAEYDSPAGAAGGAPVVAVALAVKLVKVPEHTIVAQTLLSVREPAAANATPQIVLAFNAAMAKVANQAVGWTLSNAVLPTPRR